MRLIYRLKASLNALNKEDESYLSYLHCKIIANNNILQAAPVRLNGKWLNTLFFLFKTLTRIKLITRGGLVFGEKSVVFYSGTLNQKNSSTGIVNQMEMAGESVLELLEPEIITNAKQEKVFFTFSDFLICIFLFFFRLIDRRRILKKNPYKGLICKKYYGAFISAYIYIPYFLRLMEEVSPKVVVVSNDHNTANRAIRLAAEMCGVTTVYIQHSSVTKYFPPLMFDFALLDGEQSLKVYEECLQVEKKLSSSMCNVILTGQKKKLTEVNRNVDRSIGLSLSVSDVVKNVEGFIKMLINKSVDLVVRYHPAQPKKMISILQQLDKKHPNLSLSNPYLESQECYLARVSAVIAGDTGMHLEVVLSGLPSFYFKFNDSKSPPHYDFLDTGLISRLPESFEGLSKREMFDLFSKEFSSDSIVRLYSETYGTSWQFKEEELAAALLVRLVGGKRVNDIVGEFEFSNDFKSTYRLNK